jgi:hypothetical protein
MILLSMGIPGDFAHWCDAVATEMIQRMDSTVRTFEANRLEAIPNSVMKSDAVRAIVQTSKPSGDLRAWLASADIPCLIAMDDPRKSVGYVMDKHQMELAPAIRKVCESCAALSELAGLKTAVTLRSDGAQEQRLKAILGLIRRVCPGVTAAELLQVCEQIGREIRGTRPGKDRVAHSPGFNSAISWRGRFSERDQTVIDGALGSYSRLFTNDKFEDNTWCRELFLLGDMKSDVATTAIDLTGRIRCLLFGPYMFLPSGAWCAQVIVGFVKETTNQSFRIEVVLNKVVQARQSIQPSDSGTYEVKIDFTVDNADLPIQIRIWNEKAAFDGKLALGGVVVRAGRSAAKK